MSWNILRGKIMSTSWDVVGSFFIGLVAALGFTPFMRTIALKTNYLDHPEKKKAHLKATPLLGGCAIYIGFMASLLFSVDISRPLLGILIGATMLLILGLIDDRMGMLPELKLCVQILAALTAFKFGLRVTTIEDYYICMFFTVFWVVGITNAFNLLDNLNGLSSGIAAIASFFFCVIAFFSKDYTTAAFTAGLMGACLGFLRYNFPKAQIFMGDTGSLVIGFLLSCIAVIGSWETEIISLSLAIPIIILAYPIFDTTLVTVIRIREGRSIFQGGKDHSSHTLSMMGLKKKRAVLIIFGICILLGTSGLLIRYSPSALGITALAVTVTGMLGFGLRLINVRQNIVGLKNAKNKRSGKTG